jgi:glutamine---fructose-6-phosphate transaminase (isomerizing)
MHHDARRAGEGSRSVSTRMAAEIGEQPDVLERTLDELLPLRRLVRELDANRRDVLFVARGTSDNAGVYGRYLLEVHAGRGASSAAPSLATHYRVRRDLSDTLVVSLSQSGRTTEIVETQRWARSLGGRTVAITNEEDSPLAAEADLTLLTRAGPEQAVPATKSHTTQLLAIAVLADALGARETTLEPALRRLPGQVQRLIDEQVGVEEAVVALAATDTTLVSGRGLAYATALEVALKLEETCLEPVRGLSYADLRHGPIAVVDEWVTALLVAAGTGPMVAGMTELAHDLARLGAPRIGIGGDAGFRRSCQVAVDGPELPETVAPIGLVVPGQLIAEALARHLGLDPDAPRGLAKVTASDPDRAPDVAR